ncbi:hypothetical protein EV368DRAFT_86167 [Lentinula lateritia]|nr:hypothetical protein EV368DRAFT_86167 [Lentinula lateritia]
MRNPFHRQVALVEIPQTAKQQDGEEKVPDSDNELRGHIEQHNHHGDDNNEGDFLSESYDSHLGEGEEQSKEGKSKENLQVFPYICPNPDPALTLLRQRLPKTEPNSLSPSTSNNSFFGGMTQKLDSGNSQPLFSPFPATSQPAKKDIPGASLGMTSDGLIDLVEEQTKCVAVVGPVELAGVFNTLGAYILEGAHWAEHSKVNQSGQGEGEKGKIQG